MKINISNPYIFVALVIIIFNPSILNAKEVSVSDAIGLRQAITEANQSVEDDVIHLASGVYILTGNSGEDDNSTGDLDVKSNIQILGTISRDTIIQSDGSDRVIDIMGNVNVRLENFTISGGDASSNDAGGGIQIKDSDVVLSNIIVKENNSSGGGGGIYSLNSNLIIQKSTINENKTDTGGAGILFDQQTLQLLNVTVSNNFSGSSGGGIAAKDGSATILNSTITGNGALSSGGEGITDGGADITLGNTIVAGNTSPPNSNPDYEGIFTSLGGNIIGNNGETNPIKFIIVNNQQPSDQIGTHDAPIDPLLGPLQNNGGLTDTHELLPGSPALNTGEDGICEPEDQRGVFRPLGGKCDIGAFEVGCGDGTKEANEACDDGNNTDGDGCSSICKLESTGGGNNNTPSSGGCGQLNPGPMNGLGYGMIILASFIGILSLRKKYR